MIEADLLDQVLELARMLRWRVAHFRHSRTLHGWRTPVSADGAGWPDLVLVRPPRIIFAELKSDNGRTSPDQDAWLADLAACGAEVHLWRPDDFDEFTEALR